MRDVEDKSLHHDAAKNVALQELFPVVWRGPLVTAGGAHVYCQP